MVEVSSELLGRLAPSCPPAQRAAIAETLAAEAELHGVSTLLRLQHFLAQIAHESAGFTRLEEGLSYSAERLMRVWPQRFPTMAAAKPFERRPFALAERVYGGRLGNRAPGDGWTYRGRGLIQITGRETYAALAARTGLALETRPSLAAQPAEATRIALAFWRWKGCNAPADARRPGGRDPTDQWRANGTGRPRRMAGAGQNRARLSDPSTRNPMSPMFTSLAAACRTPLAQVVACAVVLLTLLCLADARGVARGRGEGGAAERARWEVRLAADQATAARLAEKQAAAGAAVGAVVGARQAEVRAVTETLIREVPRYVTLEADARCDVPVGLVRLHDAAAAGVSVAADTAGQPADAPSGVALSAVAETVTDNYGACHANAEALKGWQAWWAAISAASAGR